MLIEITKYQEMDKRKLMEVYSEGNHENADYFYPDETDKKAAIRKAEEDFQNFLKNDFFNKTKATYWTLEINGVWVSALRTCRVQENLYYLEALETRPDCRKKGYGTTLLSSVVEALKKNGSFQLCSCVNKQNVASLKTHEKNGFKVVSEEGYNYLSKAADKHHFSLEYCCHAE